MRDFIASGHFGPIHLGAPRAVVEATLGPPDGWSNSQRRSKADIWKYGAIEFYFEADVLWMIFCDDFDTPCDWIDGWILRRGLAIARAEAQLQGSGIEFSRADVPNLPGDIHLIATSGVRLKFTPSESGALELDSCSIVSLQVLEGGGQDASFNA